MHAGKQSVFQDAVFTDGPPAGVRRGLMPCGAHASAPASRYRNEASIASKMSPA